LTKSQVTETEAQITETLPTTGTYTILVAAPEPNQTGSYQLSWEAVSSDSQSILIETSNN
jgi:methionine-rich copper-binding protein CopC